MRGEVRQDVRRHEMRGRSREMRGGAGRCGEMRGGAGRCVERDARTCSKLEGSGNPHRRSWYASLSCWHVLQHALGSGLAP